MAARKQAETLAVQIEAPPVAHDAARPATWVRARLVDVARVTGRHSAGYTFRFACDEERHPGAGEVSGTVWEPIHAGRPIHHWLEILAGRPPCIGEEIDLPALVGAEVDVFCEEETEPDPATGRRELQVVDLRRAGAMEDD
jgi:hypothetical protein